MDSDTLLTRVDERGLQIDSIERAQMRRAVRARLLDEAAVPTCIDRYVVTGRLGSGGMGVVYAARDVELSREVAVKLLLDPGDRGAESQQRLLREARALAQLAHPNVVAIHDVGMHGDRVFVAMELVRGDTLRVHARDRCSTWRERLRAYLQAGQGLAAAHAAGLVHRDFKPDNALVGVDGRVRVLDFGLAQRTGPIEPTSRASRDAPESSARLTATGDIAGTPAYMAPEQLNGGIADARADQFSFCVALWEQLHRQHPFDGPDTAAVRRAIASGRISPVPRGSDVPSWLRDVLLRGLATDPAARWPSMLALLRACERDPTRRRAVVATVATAMVVIGAWFGAAQLGRAASARACDELGPDLGAVWNEATAARVTDDFVATELAHAPTSAAKLDARLTAWRDDWTDAHRESCRAHGVLGTLGDAAWSRRTECFDARADRFTALVDALAQPDRDAVNSAVRAAIELPDHEACTDDTRLAARAGRLGPEVDTDVASDIRRRLARAGQLATLGRIARARVDAESARSDALALGHPALVAEAQLRWAALLANSGDFAGAAEENADAYFAAMRVGDDELGLSAAIQAVILLGVDLARSDDGLEWIRHAQILVDRLGPGHEWQSAELEHAMAELQRATGERDAALAAYRRVIALRTLVAGDEHPLVGEAQVDLGGLLTERGEYDEADAALIAGERILAAAYGDEAPTLAGAASTRCSLEHLRGNYEQGLPHCERAARMREAELGPDHPSLAGALSNLASARLVTGDDEGARELVTRAIAIRRAKLEPNHPALANSLNNLGVIERNLGHLDDAEAHLEEALQIRRSALASGHPDIAATAISLADVLLARGDIVGARARYEEGAAITTGELKVARRVRGRALAGIGTTASHMGDLPTALAAFAGAMATPYADEGDPASRCELRHDYAHALWTRSHRDARVSDLLRDARAACVEAGVDSEQVIAELDLWLERGAPPTKMSAAEERRSR